jgi:hypothetical protein
MALLLAAVAPWGLHLSVDLHLADAGHKTRTAHRTLKPLKPLKNQFGDAIVAHYSPTGRLDYTARQWVASTLRTHRDKAPRDLVLALSANGNRFLASLRGADRRLSIIVLTREMRHSFVLSSFELRAPGWASAAATRFCPPCPEAEANAPTGHRTRVAQRLIPHRSSSVGTRSE